jgi:uncharacterized membrane protein/protein-disulfide isomerase
MSRKPDTTEHKLVLLVRALLLAALVISVYLAWVSFGGSAVAGCGPDSGCDKVLNSRWSKWFGIPVGVPAFFLYTLMLAAVLRLTPKASPQQQRRSWSVLVPAAWVVIGAVVWFIALQLFVINAMCPFCMAAHACGLVSAAILLYLAPVHDAPEKPWQREKDVYVVPKHARLSALLGLAAVGVLIAGQLVYRPKQFEVTSIGGAKLQQTPAARIFEIYEGRFKFNMNEVPLIGSPSAPRAIVSLFDYTCHHCRDAHGLLKQAHQRFSNQLAIVSLPMPFDSTCNYTITKTQPAHVNACEYARLGLAVWQANRQAHHQFDDWLFEPEHPPDLAIARQRAMELVGAEQLQAALTNKLVNEHLQLSMSLFATNYYYARQGSIPQLIVGTNLIAGPISADALLSQLQTQLGLGAGPAVSHAQ